MQLYKENPGEHGSSFFLAPSHDGFLQLPLIPFAELNTMYYGLFHKIERNTPCIPVANSVLLW